MKVILKKDVANVGIKNEVVEVSNGYAQNHLIARGLAEVATPKKVAHAEKLVASRRVEMEAAKEALVSGMKKVDGDGLVIRANANEKDHLFEAVSAHTIAAHLKDIIGVEVSSDAIHIKSPIKELGEHEVSVSVGAEKVLVKISVQNNN